MAIKINAYDNTEEGTWEFELGGEVDISNAHEFRSQVETAISERRQSIRIDLSELNYIDSAGLGVIIGAYGSIRKDGLRIKLVNPRPNVRKLLTISGFDRVLM